MTSGTLCRCSSSHCDFTMRLDELSPSLEAGYRASLDCDVDGVFETAHFTVIKTRDEWHSARSFLQPFYSRWRFLYPALTPTIIILSVKSRHACGEICIRKRCDVIIRSMCRAAREANMIPYGIAYDAAEVFLESSFLKRLGIPGAFIPAGAFGISYPGFGRSLYAS